MRPDRIESCFPPLLHVAMRLDKRVAEQFGLSRRAAQDAVRNGRIDVDGARCDEPGREIEPATPVAYFASRPKARTVSGRLKVLHEDRHVLVVDKPPGLLTLPTRDHERDTLVDRAARYLTVRYGVPRPYVGVIHRLDKDTSGRWLWHVRRRLYGRFRPCSRPTTSSAST